MRARRRSVPVFLVGAGLALLVEVARAAPAVAPSAEEVQPLDVGERAPAVTLRDLDGRDVALAALWGEKPVVLIFYRGGWWPYCNGQLGKLQQIEASLHELGYRLVAASADRPEKLRGTLKEHGLSYTLLSDARADGARGFGIAWRVSAAERERLRGYGIDLEEASGQDHHLLPVPAVFLIDREGVIRFRYFNPDYRVRIDNASLLEAARRVAGERPELPDAAP